MQTVEIISNKPMTIKGVRPFIVPRSPARINGTAKYERLLTRHYRYSRGALFTHTGGNRTRCISRVAMSIAFRKTNAPIWGIPAEGERVFFPWMPSQCRIKLERQESDTFPG